MHYTSREVYEFISKQTNDPIVERKTCTVSGQPFAIFQSDVDFYAKISPTFNGQKFPIPTPTLCPEERQRRRLSFRNERKLYRRQCDASKKSIISIYSPDKPYKVYDQKVRRSDSRDPMDYGMNFDFSKTFAENFRLLYNNTPRVSLLNVNNEHSDYTNFTASSKSCFMCATTAFSEEMLYTSSGRYSKNCIDGIDLVRSNNCYDCININSSSYLFHSQNCSDCSYGYYLFDCVGCTNCYKCTNLRNKSYYYLNKQYSKEEYKAIIEKNIKHQDIQRILLGSNNINSELVIGDTIKNSSSSILCYNGNEGQDLKYCFNYSNIKDSYDCSCFGFNSYLNYDTIAAEDLTNSLFCFGCTHLDNCYYVDSCFRNSNLFGCIGLRNKSYCIFNKQYTKEEYEIQVAKIIAHMQITGEWGEFFHPSISPFGYNETVAQEYYYTSSPSLLLSEKGDHKNESPSLSGEGFGVRFEDLKIFGYKRSTYNADPSLPAGVQTIEKKNYTKEQRTNLLQQDNLETQVFLCSVSGRPYRLQKAEIEFYRKHHLPIPDKHPDIRHEERMKLRPGRTLFLRTCDCCGKEMLSVYPVIARTEDEAIHNAQDMDRHAIARDDKEQKVYCEQCYQQEMYS